LFVVLDLEVAVAGSLVPTASHGAYGVSTHFLAAAIFFYSYLIQ